MPESIQTPAPWHLWVIGVIALLWNAMGAFDYVMSQSKNEAYMKMFTPEQLEYFYSFPSWSVALWAIAVWGGMLGCILLLLRNKLAVCTFLISLICMTLNTIYIYAFTNGIEIMGDPFSLVFSAAIFLVAVFLYVYSKKIQANNIIV
ncbi:MAG: hypothetical protein GKR92_06060 [Gammaproteobacteria bacterium]|nr:MAG: hypothetical protein GKR92_06060 [Gammaproteobacteria bacterium]